MPISAQNSRALLLAFKIVLFILKGTSRYLEQHAAISDGDSFCCHFTRKGGACAILLVYVVLTCIEFVETLQQAWGGCMWPTKTFSALVCHLSCQVVAHASAVGAWNLRLRELVPHAHNHWCSAEKWLGKGSRLG